MKMIAHEAEAQNDYVKTQDTDSNVIHSSNKIFLFLKNVILLQSVTAYVIITFHFLVQDIPVSRK